MATSLEIRGIGKKSDAVKMAKVVKGKIREFEKKSGKTGIQTRYPEVKVLPFLTTNFTGTRLLYFCEIFLRPALHVKLYVTGI